MFNAERASYCWKKICINLFGIVQSLHNGLWKQHCGRSKNNQCENHLMVLGKSSLKRKQILKFYSIFIQLPAFYFRVTCVKMRNERKIGSERLMRLLRPFRCPFFDCHFIFQWISFSNFHVKIYKKGFICWSGPSFWQLLLQLFSSVFDLSHDGSNSELTPSEKLLFLWADNGIYICNLCIYCDFPYVPNK